MDEITKELGLDGPGYSETFGTKVYIFVPLSQGMKGEFATWVSQRAEKSIMDSFTSLRKQARLIKDDLITNQSRYSPDEQSELAQNMNDLQEQAQSLFQSFSDRRTAGVYEFHGIVCQEALQTIPGSVKLIYLMLREKQPKITEKECEDLYLNNMALMISAVRKVMGVEDLGKSKSRTKDQSSLQQ